MSDIPRTDTGGGPPAHEEAPNRAAYAPRRRRTPPIAYAADAQRAAGHGLRARLYAYRCREVRHRFFNRGGRAFYGRDWPKAAYYLPHVVAVRDDDYATRGRVMLAVALKQLGDHAAAEALWAEAVAKDPVALALRSALVRNSRLGLEPRDLPGDEPTDVVQVQAMIAARAAAEEQPAA